MRSRSTGASPTSRTPAPGPSSTTSSPRPSPATTPTPPRPIAAQPRTGVGSTSTLSRATLTGTVEVHGELDLADALDLDTAITRTAAQLADLGNTESLDVRRSLAAGELARHQLTLDLTTGEQTTGSAAGVGGAWC